MIKHHATFVILVTPTLLQRYLNHKEFQRISKNFTDLKQKDTRLKETMQTYIQYNTYSDKIIVRRKLGSMRDGTPAQKWKDIIANKLTFVL